MYSLESFFQRSHGLESSSNWSSSTMTMHSFTGQISAHLPQPTQYWYSMSYKPSLVGSKHSSGHSTQQSVHLVQRSNRTAGLCVLVVPRLNMAFLDCPRGPISNPRLTAGTAAPSCISNHLGSTGTSCVHTIPSFGVTVFTRGGLASCRRDSYAARAASARRLSLVFSSR